MSTCPFSDARRNGFLPFYKTIMQRNTVLFKQKILCFQLLDIWHAYVYVYSA